MMRTALEIVLAIVLVVGVYMGVRRVDKMLAWIKKDKREHNRRMR